MSTPTDPVTKLVPGRRVETIDAGANAADAARRMARSHVGSLVVLDGDRPAGLLTDRDLALGVLATGQSAEGCSVADLMTRPLITLPWTATLGDATRVMRRHGVHRLPIVNEQGDLVGLIAADDLQIALGERLLNASKAIRTEWHNEALPPECPSCFGKE